ncbi:putative mitochondrial protein, partial [Mucuna pruriens]
MKELGKLKYFIRIKVSYSKQGIFISQRKYVLDLFKEIGKLGCKTSEVPIEQNHKIECEESPIIEKSQYQRLVGKLIYLSHTRPDIAYVVSVVSQFMHDRRERHLQAVEKILQYLKARLGKGLFFRKEVQHDRTKHIEVDRYFIKEKLDSGLIVTAHIPTWLQVADVFTKGLLATRFQELNGKLGMIDIHLPT